MSLLSWLTRFKKQRRASRQAAIDCLEAVYWNGAVNCSHTVREISLSGAVIETSLNWGAGTLIYMVLRPVRSEEAEKAALFMGIWTKVVRTIADGFCVQFVYMDRKEAMKFREFLETAVGGTWRLPR
jgi:hypothetical protein